MQKLLEKLVCGTFGLDELKTMRLNKIASSRAFS